MSKRIPAIASLAAPLCLLLLLGACAQTGEQPGDPLSVAKKAVEVSLAYDMDGLSALSCAQMRKEIEEQRGDFEETMNILKGMGVDLSQVRYDMSGVTFEVVSQGELTAKVHMGGVLKVKVPGLPEESQEQNQDIELRKEDNEWLVCSELQS
ncbi:hypothetical protein [Paucidesulfovibrio longus]|uniref:hypothetical protein n=1 Tax=Paucidesulfovibrio longus TaxID=889 RepID=UPI0003B4BBDB|nr:hypothetical protein [Paucidesulfovibrio longus]